MNVVFGMRELPGFEPNPANVIVIPNGGPTVYNHSVDITEVNGRARIEARCVVPGSALEPYLNAAGLSLGAQAGNVIEIWVIDESPVEGGLGVADLYDTIKSGFDFQDKMNQLNALLDRADANCSGNAGGYYHGMADYLAKSALTNLCVKYGMQLGGMALGATGIGLVGSVALWGVSSILTEVADARWDTNLQKLQQELNNDEECKRDDDDDDNDNNDDDNPGPKKKKKVVNPKYIWDPSGYVYEVLPENRLQGVTATALEKDPATGRFGVWDAVWYEQDNPQVTDAQGRYAWDVPEGDWQVVYEKEGYQTAFSEVMHVPPPRTEVNVGLVSFAPPAVTGVTAVPGGGYLEVNFDKFMRTGTLTPGTVTVVSAVYGEQDEFGDPVTVAGSVYAVNPVPDPNAPGIELARTVRFTPAAPFTVGGAYTVHVNQLVQSYAQRPMAADFSRTVTIPEGGGGEPADTTPPGPGDGPAG